MEPLALFYHPDVLDHDTSRYQGHPERAARLKAVVETLERDGLGSFRAPEPATASQLTRVHATGYVATVDRIARGGGGYFDPDTLASAGSFRAATRAAGGAIAAAVAVLTGEAKRAFALVRPPGHHARPAQAMGFCLFDNVAVAAREAQAVHGVGRVAIVDLDVHHGNGTQEIFYEDRDVLYVSTHQYPFYPGTGALEETGVGNVVNVPLPAGCGDAEYARAMEQVVLPAVRGFRPELLLISVGYDAHWADPLAYMQLTTSGYVAAVEALCGAGDDAGAPVALALEPELVVYQAGVDVYEGDRLGGLKLTEEGIIRRDMLVRDACRARGVPVAVTLGGGYADSAETTARLHANTLELFSD